MSVPTIHDTKKSHVNTVKNRTLSQKYPYRNREQCHFYVVNRPIGFAFSLNQTCKTPICWYDHVMRSGFVEFAFVI